MAVLPFQVIDHAPDAPEADRLGADIARALSRRLNERFAIDAREAVVRSGPAGGSVISAVDRARSLGAEQHFRRALRAPDPSATAHQWHAAFLQATGRQLEARAELGRALQLDPF